MSCGTKKRTVEDATLASVLGSTWVVGYQRVQGGREGEAEGRGKGRVRMEHVGSGMSAAPCGPEAGALRVGRVRGEAALRVGGGHR